MALLGITKLAPVDRMTSALALLIAHPNRPEYRCPKEACSQLAPGECGRFPFCGSSLRLTVDLPVSRLRADTEQEAASENGTTVDESVRMLLSKGDVRTATDLFKEAMSQVGTRCHASLAPFQQVFAQRCVLPRTSIMAYWGVGTGKTAGAAAVLLQAGAAIRLDADGKVALDAVPVHSWSLADSFIGKVRGDMMDFGDNGWLQPWMAISAQLDRVSNVHGAFGGEPRQLAQWAVEWNAGVEALSSQSDQEAAEQTLRDVLARLTLPNIDSYVASLVLINEAHFLDDPTYRLLKATNMVCQWSPKDPGFAPVIATFTGTPCAGGLRGLLMVLDLMNNARKRDGDVQDMDIPGYSDLPAQMDFGNLTFFSLIDTYRLMSWLNLSIYQTARVGDLVSLPVHPDTLRLPTMDESQLTRMDPRQPFYRELGGEHLYRARAEALERKTGRVTRVVPSQRGLVMVDVELDAEGDAEGDADPVTVRAPALLLQPKSAGPQSVQKGRPRLIVNHNGTEIMIADEANPSDHSPATTSQEDIVIQQPLTLVHGPDHNRGFEATLVDKFSPWGQMSYVNLSETGLFPTRTYQLVSVDPSPLPEATFLRELPSVLYAIRSGGGGDELDAVRRAVQANPKPSKGFSVLTGSASNHAWYTTNFYTAALLLAMDRTDSGWIREDGAVLGQPDRATQAGGFHQPPESLTNDERSGRRVDSYVAEISERNDVSPDSVRFQDGLPRSEAVLRDWLENSRRSAVSDPAVLARHGQILTDDADANNQRANYMRLRQAGLDDRSVAAMDTDSRKRLGRAIEFVEQRQPTLELLLELGMIDKKDVTKQLPVLIYWIEILQAVDVLAVLRELAPPKVLELLEVASNSHTSNRFNGEGAVPVLGYVPYGSIVGLLAISLAWPTQPRTLFWAAGDRGVGLFRPFGRGHSPDAPPLMLVSDAAGADDLDSDAFSLGGRHKPNQLLFVTVPPSRQRMVQVEGRLHRHGCDEGELHGVRRGVTFYLMCSGWAGAKPGNVIESIATRQTVRPLDSPAHASEHGRTFHVSNAWEALKEAHAGHERSGHSATDSKPRFSDLDFLPYAETSPDARAFMDLQMGVSDYPEFFASLAQQFSIERASGDNDAIGPTVEWIGLVHPPSLDEALDLCRQYLATFGTQPGYGDDGPSRGSKRPKPQDFWPAPSSSGVPAGAAPEDRERDDRDDSEPSRRKRTKPADEASDSFTESMETDDGEPLRVQDLSGDL